MQQISESFGKGKLISVHLPFVEKLNGNNRVATAFSPFDVVYSLHLKS